MSQAAIAPIRIENEAGKSPVILVVDHASNHIPPPWNDLGLGEAERLDHIAWDPGALPLGRILSRMLDATLVHATVSRLVLDLNRPLTSATLMPAISETTVVPGNQAISDADRARRIAEVYEPYHQGLADLVARKSAEHAGPLALVALHSFTPVFKGVTRDVEIGVLFDRDERLGGPMLAHLRRENGLKAEANQPYAPGDEVYTTLNRHAVQHGHLNVMIEIRNDLLRTEDARLRWAQRLTDAISSTLATVGSEARDPRQKTG